MAEILWMRRKTLPNQSLNISWAVSLKIAYLSGGQKNGKRLML